MSNTYKFDFPDGLTAEDHQLDTVTWRGTWLGYMDREIAELRAGGKVKLAEILEEGKHEEDRGYCEYCRLRHGTGAVIFLQGKPERAPLAPNWIWLDNAAQICIFCAAKLGYISPNHVSVSVPKHILNALRRQTGPAHKSSIGSKLVHSSRS